MNRVGAASVLLPVSLVSVLVAGCEANGPRIENVHPLGAASLASIVPECKHPTSTEYTACKKAAEMLEVDPVTATQLYLANWDHVAFGAPLASAPPADVGPQLDFVELDQVNVSPDLNIDVDLDAPPPATASAPAPPHAHTTHVATTTSHAPAGSVGGGHASGGGVHPGSMSAGGRAGGAHLSGGGHGGGGGHSSGGSGGDMAALAPLAIVLVAGVVLVVAVVAAHHAAHEARISRAESITTRTLRAIYERSGDPYSLAMLPALRYIHFRSHESRRAVEDADEAARKRVAYGFGPALRSANPSSSAPADTMTTDNWALSHREASDPEKMLHLSSGAASSGPAVAIQTPSGPRSVKLGELIQVEVRDGTKVEGILESVTDSMLHVRTPAGEDQPIPLVWVVSTFQN